MAYHNGMFFDEVPQERVKQFAERVKAAQGKVMIVVHPFFVKDAPASYYRKVVQTLKKSKWPVVIMEEAEQIEALRERLKRYGIEEPLIVPSISRNKSDPAKNAGGILRLRGNGGKEKEDDKGKELVKLISNSGGKEVFVEGMYAGNLSMGMHTFNHLYPGDHLAKSLKNAIMHETTWLAKTREHDFQGTSLKSIIRGCAGAVYRHLINSGKFSKVRLVPNAVHPAKPTFKINERKLAEAREAGKRKARAAKARATPRKRK